MYRFVCFFVLISTFFMIGCSIDKSDRKQLFDNDWQFSLNGEDWRSLDLPHDWSIEGDFSPENKMGNAGGYLPDGVGTYRKSFTLGKQYEGKKVALYFEGSYMTTTVTVNGKKVGTHDYGYTSFIFDITDYIKINEENTLEVTVDNSKQENCRWYSGSGIYRHVWLITTDKIHLKHWGNYITTPVVSEEKATVLIKTVVQNETDREETVMVRADIDDECFVEQTVLLAAQSEKEVELELEVTKPHLWNVWTKQDDKPYLYEAKISVLSEKRNVIDTITETFGIRTIEYSAEEGFKLNGQNMKIFGGCLHHDNGILGASAFNRAEERKVEMMKAAGFNALRTSHNPVSEALLDACDRLGMLVIDEAFDGWYAPKTAHGYHELIDKHWHEDLSSMILRDRNHPSIIAWSIGNEIMERDSPEAVTTARKFVSLCHELDPTRPVTQALACWNDKWIGQDALAAEHDIVGYNYLLDWAPEDHKRVPERIIWQTESYPRDVYKNYKLVSENPYIIGDFVWTSIDYIGESSIGRWYYEGEDPGEHYWKPRYPWHGAYCGDIDLTGWRKPVSYYRQLVFSPQSASDIYMAVKEPDGYHGKIYMTQWSVWPTWNSWNWSGWEGKKVEVEVYSKYPEVRLYLNGKSVSDFVKNNEFLTTFSVPYEEGDLRAVGVVEGKEVGEVILSTAGEPCSLRLTADRSLINSDGQDLSFITVEVVDKEGRLCPNAEIAFSCSITNIPKDNTAQIVAIGNANLQDCDPYYDLNHKTWKGRALIVVRSPRNPGKAELEVVSDISKDICSIQFK